MTVHAPTRAAARAARAGGAQRPLRVTVLALVASALLITVTIVGFVPSFAGTARVLIAGIGAMAIGLGLAWVGARWRWGILELSGAAVAAYFVFGGALALPNTTLFGVIPTLETWRRLAVGTVTSFKELLTTVAPVAATDGHLIVPFLLVLLASVIVGSLALRTHPGWALIPAVALLVGQILLGTGQPAAPLVQGLLFAAVGVIWLALHQRWFADRAAVRVESTQVGGALRVRRLVTGAAVVAVALGAGVATAAFADPPAQRFVLRDFVVPPFSIQDYASPLQSWRGIVRDSAEQTLFTVSGLPEGARVRLATMDAYDGIVYNVSDTGLGSSGAFTPARSNMSPDATGDATTVRIEVEGLSGVWLPDVGAVTDIAFDGDRADLLQRTAHYNDATGTALVTAGLTSGDAYTLQTRVAAPPSDEQLADATFAMVKLPKQAAVSESLVKLASAAVADAETPFARARALEAWLHTSGYFSHGLADDVYSPSGHGASRIISLVNGSQMVGDDEQYAVTFALMANRLGMPARVVMGWYPDEDEQSQGVFAATGDNMHAWAEIAFADYGWVAFDPTPDEDNEPSEQNTQPKATPKPQVLQPPPPAQEPADEPPVEAEEREQEEDEEEDAAADWIGPVLMYGGIGLGTIALMISPFIVIGAIKGARRARRRRAERAADRISGGWDELVDTAIDLRVPVAAGATRAESARAVGETYDGERVTALATRADAKVYGPGEPTPQEVEAFWNEVDSLVGGMKVASTWRGRMRARLSVRSLRRSGR